MTIALRLQAALEATTSPLAPARAALAVDAPALGLAWRGGTADRPFRIASITKPFVAATIHRLREEGMLTLDDTIARHATAETLLALTRGGYDCGAITLAQLLSHTSGLTDHSVAPGFVRAVAADPRRRWTRAEQIALAMRAGPPIGPPGACYAYADTGYIVLGEIIERVTGLSLAQAVRRLVRLDALGMAQTWWETLEEPPAGAPELQPQWHDGASASDWHPSFDLFGGGGLISTVGDLNRFLAALLAGEILRPATVAEALATPAVAPAQATTPGRNHSLLLATMRIGERWCLGHTGFWGSATVRLPGTGATVSLSINASGDRAWRAMLDLLELIDTMLVAEWCSRSAGAKLSP